MEKMKRQLTPAEKIAIVHEYESGDLSMDALSKKYGVSKSTISRTIKSGKKKYQDKPSTVEKNNPVSEKNNPVQISSNQIPDDPILFRRMKLAEISNDIETARLERVVHSLPAFHKLHIQVHNEMLEHIEAAGDELREMSMDEHKRLLIDAFVNLPPIIRHELLEVIEAHESGNVIRLKTKND
jgi:transposase-like protein